MGLVDKIILTREIDERPVHGNVLGLNSNSEMSMEWTSLHKNWTGIPWKYTGLVQLQYRFQMNRKPVQSGLSFWQLYFQSGQPECKTLSNFISIDKNYRCMEVTENVTQRKYDSTVFSKTDMAFVGRQLQFGYCAWNLNQIS